LILALCAGCGARPDIEEISVGTPTGWILRVGEDGAGRIEYGSSFGDSAAFPKGTFAFADLLSRLKAVTHEQGTCPPDCTAAFRKRGESSTKAVCISDLELIRQFMEKAVSMASGNGSQRVQEILKEHPFLEPDKRVHPSTAVPKTGTTDSVK
jgi:hypothetical protein